MLERTGYVRDYTVTVGPGGITGRCRAPARLVRQSLAPVLRVRDIEWSISSHSETPRGDEIVTVRLTDGR